MNPKKEKIYIPYDEPPFIIDEKSDFYMLNEEKKNQENDIIQNNKNENINKLKDIYLLYSFVSLTQMKKKKSQI